MKINEVLNKVTLKLPGGGKFPLSKYAPYITNVDEDVEDLGGNGIPFIKENIVWPDAYTLDNYFESEDDMWEYRYRVNVLEQSDVINNYMSDRFNHNVPKIFTSDELFEYYNLLKKVFGDYTGNQNNNDLNVGSILTSFDFGSLLFKNEIKENEYIVTDVYFDSYYIGYSYIKSNYVICMNEEINEMINQAIESGDAPEEMINFEKEVIENYYVYTWKDIEETLPEIPQEQLDRLSNEIVDEPIEA